MAMNLKPEHKTIKSYYTEMEKLTGFLNAKTEGAVAPIFSNLLRHCAGQMKRTLIEQHTIKRKDQIIRVDGAIVDEFKLVHGLWEAKDSADDLGKEIKAKVEKGYPRENILFQAPDRAVLYQDGRLILDADITKPINLIEILELFFEYEPPAYNQWEQAVEEFKLKVPEFGEGLLKLIEEQRKTNPEFVRAFEDFTRVVQEAINPNISTQAVEEMLIQHILTERIFRKIFNNSDFATRNIIASEIEKVVRALTSRSFSRDGFLGSLDRFYGAIEETASTITDYSEKQSFLNVVYEKFFQGFSVKAADIYGIVYTPQPIVNFMVNSVEHILKEEFGRSLSDENVHIIDPFVGTGNFIINIMNRIQKTKLPQKYADELHCNEVMLLPYYIASMNIEHAYFELTGTYKPFDGICLVDTFEDVKQMGFFGHENTQRIAKQHSSPIFIVIANPPYNAGQVNENDNNRNRKYPVLDKRIADTYGKDSSAQLVRKLNDPYIKAIRWATDKIKEEGIVAYITNNSFIDDITCDGMRYHLERDFSKIIHINLKGNAHTSGERRRKEGGNIFNDQIRVSVGITFFIRKINKPGKTIIEYYDVGDYKDSYQKQEYLITSKSIENLGGKTIIRPNQNHLWLSQNYVNSDSLLPLASKEVKNSRSGYDKAIFRNYSLGLATNRDDWLYDFDRINLKDRVKKFINNYNLEVHRWISTDNKKNINDFVNSNPAFIKWTDRLKSAVIRGELIVFDEKKISKSHYRPFVSEFVYFDSLLNQRQYRLPRMFPTKNNKKENILIALPSIGGRGAYWCLATNEIPNLTLTSVDANQCFSFYIYTADGSTQNENITDWALNIFRDYYADNSITKWSIFQYIYGFLHHPEYRTKYIINLRRELPRIPYAPDFWAFSKAGKRLVEIHVNYEDQPEYPLTMVENPNHPLDWRVEKMKLSPDKTAIIYNDFLTLTGIPPEVYEYKLGNRSALEWIIDQYRVKTDKRSGIVNDPNNPDDPDYIVRLIKKIVTVSLETVQIVKGLPEEFE